MWLHFPGKALLASLVTMQVSIHILKSENNLTAFPQIQADTWPYIRKQSFALGLSSPPNFDNQAIFLAFYSSAFLVFQKNTVSECNKMETGESESKLSCYFKFSIDVEVLKTERW